MKTSGQIRRENLERLVKEVGTLDAVASRAETTSVYLSQVRNQARDNATGKLREMGPAMARRLERAFNKDQGWMDVDQEVLTPSAAPPPLPPRNFDDRREMSDSDWATLEAVKVMLGESQLAEIRAQYERSQRALAERMKEMADKSRP